LQLSQVMHQQNGDVEAVGNALDGGNVIVGNHLHAHAALAIVQRQAVAAIIVGAQPPD